MTVLNYKNKNLKKFDNFKYVLMNKRQDILKIISCLREDNIVFW